jgi:hypothetical protein
MLKRIEMNSHCMITSQREYKELSLCYEEIENDKQLYIRGSFFFLSKDRFLMLSNIVIILFSNKIKTQLIDR